MAASIWSSFSPPGAPRTAAVPLKSWVPVRPAPPQTPPPSTPQRAGRPPPPPPYLRPIQLYASVDVQSGAEVGFRTESLQNREARPIDVHEIRLSAIIAAAGAGLYADPGIFMEVNLDLDGKSITNGYVPLWLFGRTACKSTYGWGSTNARGVATMIWRLAQPMQLRPGSVINAHVRHRGLVTASVTVDLSLIGNLAASARPGLNRIPYITAFLAQPVDYNVGGIEISPETALQNTLSRVLNVERLVGRVALYFASGGAGVASDTYAAEHYSNLTRLKLAHSAGQQIARDLIPFGNVFSPASGFSLECPFTMAPKGYLIATTSTTARTTPVSSQYGLSYKVQPQISLVGWREE